jgi:hypothetical protein
LWRRIKERKAEIPSSFLPILKRRRLTLKAALQEGEEPSSSLSFTSEKEEAVCSKIERAF